MSAPGSAIPTKDIWSVLLADGWHDVLAGSFAIRTYEFVSDPDTRQSPWPIHQADGAGYSFLAFRDESENSDLDTCWMSGPVSAILAVKHDSTRGGAEIG